MIDYEQAIKLIMQSVPQPTVEEVSLLEALGCVTADVIWASFSMPLFDNSAMDGFVFRSEDSVGAKEAKPVILTIAGTIRAGDTEEIVLGPMEAYRIMTGARMPKNADTVIPIEKSEATQKNLYMRSFWPENKNVRFQGEEFKKDQIVVEKDVDVTPAILGIAASLGKGTIRVYRRPTVAVITTGNELIEPGMVLAPGKIYDSNLPMIRAALHQMGLRPVLTKRLGDKPNEIRRVVGYALKMSDVVLLMGGVSAGETDYVKEVLADLGVEQVFWKVSQKPGKPLYFGKKLNTIVFGLPGNPASVFTCFYEYTYPALRKLMGFKHPGMKEVRMELQADIETDSEKTIFLKGKLKNDRGVFSAVALRRQASHMISSLAEATGILFVPKQAHSLKAGDKIVFQTLPYATNVP